MNTKNTQTEDTDYEFKLNMVRLDISAAKWWQQLTSEEKQNFARRSAESEHAAELQIAAEFDRTPEPIEIKIKRIVADYEALAKKYPIR